MRYLLNNFVTDINIINTFSDFSSTNRVLIIDKNIYKLFKKDLKVILEKSPTYLFEAIETNKTFDKIKEIYSFLIDNNVTRETAVMGIGGGITTDITAFAASTFKRGCRLQLIPTTFLGMIDASIGGKTAINFRGLKNTIGSFYPAEKIYIYIDFLKTLSDKELKNGWAECVKIALINGNKLLLKLSKGKQTIEESILTEAIRIKMEICAKDLFDNGKRQYLNLGHTVGHMIEVVSNFSIPHGTSVALGIKIMAEISFSKGFISKNRFNEILQLLTLYKLNEVQQLDIDHTSILNLLKHDKKNRKLMSFVLFNEKSVFVQKLTMAEAVALIEKHINNSK